MTNSNQQIYKIIKGKVSSRHLETILGASLYKGLVNYIEKYSSNNTIDYAELLINSLGTKIIFNDAFQKFLIERVFDSYQINKLSNLLQLSIANNSELREKILLQKNKKIAAYIIELLNLNQSDYYEDKTSDLKKSNYLIVEPDNEKYLSLHDYQKKIKDEVVKNLIENPKARMLVHMPTGSGKTKTCVEAMIDFIRTRPFQEGLIIWFAHSTELCEQAHETLLKNWKLRGDYPLPVFKIFGDNDAVEDILTTKLGVLFIGFQKFRSIQNSGNVLMSKIRIHLSTNTKLVIIDEAHKSLAKTYADTISYVSSMPDCRLIGLTATPGRSSNVNDPSNAILSDLFGNHIITIKSNDGYSINDPLKYLQDKRVLAKIDHKPIQVDLNEFTNEELIAIMNNKELEQDQIDKIVESPIRNKIIIDQIDKSLRDPNKDLILVFACSTNHCILIQKLLELQNIESQVILASTASNLREKYIKEFKSGKLKVLINFGVLTTGFDAPKLKTLIIARHTNSIILYSQMIGRALRGPLNGGNEVNYIIDLVDNISKLGNPEFLFNYWEDFWGRKINFANN